MAYARLGWIVLSVISFVEQSVVTVYWYPPRVKSTAAVCCTKKLFCKKICALEINRAANKLIISRCILSTSAHYCCTTTTTAVCIRTAVNVPHPQTSRHHDLPIRTANNTAIRARTLLMYHDYYYYTAVCIRTSVNVPHPQNSRCLVPRRFLELDMA